MCKNEIKLWSMWASIGFVAIVSACCGNEILAYTAAFIAAAFGFAAFFKYH